MNSSIDLISCSWHPTIPGKGDDTHPLRQHHSTQLLAKLPTKKTERKREGRKIERDREGERERKREREREKERERERERERGGRE